MQDDALATPHRKSSQLAGSYTSILLFWAPLAAQWIMMAAEGPFLAAVIARMADPVFNLAAYGVAFAFAILVESPVIMLMSASTALVEDAASYRRLRTFATMLNAGSTALLLTVLIPPVYDLLMTTMLGLPAPVADLVYGSLWILLPWPAAIGYRRFLHGVLITTGRTRLVAYGTLLRLGGMAGTALLLYATTGLPGAWVGAAALSAGVCVEALAARIMAIGAVRELLADEPAIRQPVTNPAMTTSSATELPVAAGPMGYRDIVSFYYPLALTSFIGLTVQPLLTFFLGRAPSPVQSLAVFPVVLALSFLFRAFAFSYQEAAIALVGRRFENIRMIARFGAVLALTASGGLALVAFTPLADLWFVTLSGLPPDLAAAALMPARILVPLPAIAVLLALQQAILVSGRTTRPITIGTLVQVLGIASLFPVFAWSFGMTGVSAAVLALIGGRVFGALFLIIPVRRTLDLS
jgi:progressive ankylosis protein